MGGRRDMLEECRQKATPAVRACVIKEGSGLRQPRPRQPHRRIRKRKQRSKATAAWWLPVSLTAAHDRGHHSHSRHEKPILQRSRCARRPPTREPPKGGSKSALAQFYYDRGNACASLAHNEDALNDALKAWEVGQGAFEEKQDTRVIQFVGLQYLAAGRPKEAIDFWLKAIGLGEQPGRRGAL